jgi:hypothetical protein
MIVAATTEVIPASTEVGVQGIGALADMRWGHAAVHVQVLLDDSITAAPPVASPRAANRASEVSMEADSGAAVSMAEAGSTEEAAVFTAAVVDTTNVRVRCAEPKIYGDQIC